MADDPRISMHHIPIRGGIGALLVIVVLIAAMLVELPELRWPFGGGALAGIVFAIVLIAWRRRRPRRSEAR